MPTPQNKTPRMLYIDGLKLIMCYMVMLIHLALAAFTRLQSAAKPSGQVCPIPSIPIQPFPCMSFLP